MFNRIERPRVLNEILEQFKQNIVNGQLKKGDRLPSERQLAEMLGVSRSMIREAVKSLEMIGLIDCVQGGGNFIASDMRDSLVEPLSIMFLLNGSDIIEVQQFRRALEIASVRLAAKRINGHDLAELDKICKTLESSAEKVDHDSIDQTFHRIIAHASGNSLLITTHNAASVLIQNQIRDVRNVILSEHDNLHQVNNQHRSIYEALRIGNADKAVAAMTHHMDYIEQHLMP